MSCRGFMLKGGGATHEDVEDKLMLEGLRALRRWRRALSFVEGSMVVVGPWSIFLNSCLVVGRSNSGVDGNSLGYITE